MSKWEPGAKAVIMISAWPKNIGRVVTLVQVLGGRNLATGMSVKLWHVEDGSKFDGFASRDPYLETNFYQLGIEQWKLRLLDDNEPVEQVGDITVALAEHL